MQREFSAHRVLVALYRINFVHRQVKFKGQPVRCLTWSPKQLELRITESSRSEAELGIKIVAAVRLSDPAESIAPAHTVAVSPVVQRGSGARHVSENQRLINLVLKAHTYVDDFVITRRAGTKISDGCGKVICFVAEWLVAAERGLGGGSGRRGSLSLGGGRRKRTERQQERPNTQNPKDRWN